MRESHVSLLMSQILCLLTIKLPCAEVAQALQATSRRGLKFSSLVSALPLPTLPWPAVPCPHRLPCPALPCLALPCPDLPCPAPPCCALACCAVPLSSAKPGFSTQPAFSHLAQVAASIEPKDLTISLILVHPYVSNSNFIFQVAPFEMCR